MQKRILLLVWGDFISGTVPIHLDVSTKGNQREAIIGVTFLFLPKFFPKTNTECFNTNTIVFGHREMAQFMHKNQKPQQNDKGTDEKKTFIE